MYDTALSSLNNALLLRIVVTGMFWLLLQRPNHTYSTASWPERTSFSAHIKQVCVQLRERWTPAEHWPLRYVDQPPFWYLIVIIERLHQSASCSRLFFDKFCWALSTKFANFNQGTLVLFYSLLPAALMRRLRDLTCFTVLCLTGIGGTIENKFLAVIKATNCMIQLRRMLDRMWWAHVAALRLP